MDLVAAYFFSSRQPRAFTVAKFIQLARLRSKHAA
jgi:hypothetical protein